MIERFVIAYQQLAKWAKQSGRIGRFVHLQFTPLEERATPAITQFLPAFPPPEMLVVAPNPPVAPSVMVAAPTNYRTDLFAMTDGGSDQPDIWEEWYADQEASHDAPAAESREVVPESATPTAEMDLDANAARTVFVAEAAGESGGE